ncbi:MAG: periplasmic heavy metal sensor [Candidatus Binatia bacterium]
MRIETKVILVAALASIVPMRVAADPPKGHDTKARTYLAVRIAEELGLDAEKALAVARVLRESDEKRVETRRKRREVEDKIRESLEKSKPDTAALAKLVDQATELDKRNGLAREETYQALRGVLSVEEQAKLVLLRPELWRDARAMMRGGRGPHPPERGPGHERHRERGAEEPAKR